MCQHRLILIILLVLTAFTAASAQEPTPALGTAQENACNEGGLLFRDGVSLCETEWHWECGWYLANWQNTGAPVPTWCGMGQQAAEPVFIGCVQGSFFYIAFGNSRALPAGAPGYLYPDCTFHHSTFTNPLVYATSESDARALCLANFGTNNIDGPFGAAVYECI